MNPLELISGVLLIVSCVIIILVVLLQESKSNLSGSIAGASSNSFYSGNKSRTKEGMLMRFTKIASILLFVVTLVLNALNVWLK